MAALTETQHTGEFVLSEANGTRSRETVTVTVPTGGLEAGSVLGQLAVGGKYVPYANADTDGRETAVAVLYSDLSGEGAGDVSAAVIARDAEVRTADLKYLSGTSANDQAAALVELAAVGIIAR